ncbi:uncharacterized protein LOC121381162 [Gigantopelta aegis]|uniref:uncharacterized protein LOC121381162 n=1 Tax=Gigantopelta aegis TaxID=1735272 RepID=UPI001B88AF50|nr:uncharacterized protein LOC121381162 [Gigantopelta aegis]
MDNFHHSEQATNMSASGLSDRSSLPMGDNFHHPEHGAALPSGSLSDRSPLPLGVDQDPPVQSWSATAAQDDVAADYSMFPATQPDADYASQQMTDIVHQTYMHSGLTQSDSYDGDHLRDMTRPQGLDMFSSRGLNMPDTYEARSSLNDQHPVEVYEPRGSLSEHPVEVYEPRGSLSEQHAMDLFQMKDVSQDSLNKGKDVPSAGRVMAESRAQPPMKMSDHLTDSRHLALSDIQDLRRVSISGIQTMCKPGGAEDSSQYTVLDMHYNNRPNMEVTSASTMSDARYQSLIDSMAMAQRVNDSRNLSAANTSRHLLPALSPQYADERPPRMVNPQYAGNHSNRPGRSVANMDTYCTKSNSEMFQADKGDAQGADRNVSLSQHRSVQRNSVDVFSERSASSFGQQIFEDSVRTSSSRTSNTNANFVYAETSAPIVKARHLCFQEEEDVQSKASGTNVSFTFVDNSVPMSKMNHQMYEDDLRTSQASAGHSEFVGGMLSSSGGSNHGSDTAMGRSDQEVLLTDKEWTQVTRLKLFHMMTNKKMCDVALKAGDLRIEIHKVVLCAASDQLAMLLDSVDSDGFPVLSTSAQVSEDVLHAFAEFLYLGSVKVTIDNINEMNKLASAFHIYALHDLCWELLEKNGAGASNRLRDLKLTFESHNSTSIQRNDCGINTDSTVGLDADDDGEASEIKFSPQSANKSGSTGRGKGRGRGRCRSQGQGRSKSMPEETKAAKPVEKIGASTHTYGTRGLAKKQLFEDGVSDENNEMKSNQKAAVKTPVQTTPKRRRMNASKPVNTEIMGEAADNTEAAAPSCETKPVSDIKDCESVVKAPVKPRHRSLKQKLMESVTEDSALDNPAVVSSNPLARLMIDEDKHTAAGDHLEDGADYTSLKGKKGKKSSGKEISHTTPSPDDSQTSTEEKS